MRRVWVALVLAGCLRGGGDDPVQAYQSFVRTLQKGDAKVAYDALSAATRKKIEERTHAVAEASDGGVKDDPASVLFQPLERPQAVTEVSVESREGDRASLRVSSASRTSEVRMVKEGTVWKVDLVDLLK